MTFNSTKRDLTHSYKGRILLSENAGNHVLTSGLFFGINKVALKFQSISFENS